MGKILWLMSLICAGGCAQFYAGMGLVVQPMNQATEAIDAVVYGQLLNMPTTAMENQQFDEEFTAMQDDIAADSARINSIIDVGGATIELQVLPRECEARLSLFAMAQEKNSGLDVKIARQDCEKAMMALEQSLKHACVIFLEAKEKYNYRLTAEHAALIRELGQQIAPADGALRAYRERFKELSSKEEQR